MGRPAFFLRTLLSSVRRDPKRGEKAKSLAAFLVVLPVYKEKKSKEKDFRGPGIMEDHACMRGLLKT